MERCCETCRYDLGGGYNNCKINLEAECAEGGYEAWKPKEETDIKEIYASIRDEMAKVFDRFIHENCRSIQPGHVLFENDLMRGVLLCASDRGEMLIDVQLLKKCPVASTRFKVDMFNMLVIEQDRIMRSVELAEPISEAEVAAQTMRKEGHGKL